MLAALLVMGIGRAAAQDCARLQIASPDELVSYLGATHPDMENSECIPFAINKVGDQRYEPAIPVLAKLLQFRWPLNARQKQRGFVLEHDGFTIYPAANALEQIGKNALPAVLDVLRAGSASKQLLQVAISVWMTIYKNQAGRCGAAETGSRQEQGPCNRAAPGMGGV